MSDVLRVERDGPIWSFTLDRPDKRNALSDELVEALIANVLDAQAQGAALLVFRGEGRNFSAGFDFGGIEHASDADLLHRFVRVETLLQIIARSPCLTLALAHGRNFGAGVDLVAACRWRIATPDASFRMPGLKFGIVLGTRRFAGIVGVETARSILESARSFDAIEAQAIGFLRGIADVETWPAQVTQARETAQSLPDSARRALYETLSDDNADADLAALVRSASEPGLGQRIRGYLAGE
jgi:enoyl-CoA hydratase